MTVYCINRKGDDMPVDPRQAAFVDRFAQGSGGKLISLESARKLPVEDEWCIRGMKFAKAVQECWQSGRKFYYIDNGYFGNVVSKRWFRIITNHVHEIRPVISRDNSRLEQFNLELSKFTPGSRILLAPPSDKSLSMWNMTSQQWINDTVEQLKKYTDRPIDIRLKRPRTERLKHNTMQEALNNDVHCLVTYNSVSAVEAVIMGKPAICLGPNAAAVVSSTSLADIENPRRPTDDERWAWLRHLSYSQFDFDEISNGTAWRILNE